MSEIPEIETFWLPFFYQALHMGSMYVKFGEHINRSFCARGHKTQIMFYGGDTVPYEYQYANEEIPGSETFCLPFYCQDLSMGSMHAKFCAYHSHIFGARALRMVTIGISGPLRFMQMSEFRKWKHVIVVQACKHGYSEKYM